MLQFNRKQMAAIGEDSLLTRLRAYLQQHLPQLREVPHPQLEQALSPLLAEARRHGLASQRAAAAFVLANVVLGRSAIARDPAAQEILADRSRPASDRGRLLEIWLARHWGGIKRTTTP